MHTSNYWIGHFNKNAKKLRINWDTEPQLTNEELATILPALQAWQLAETSDGKHLILASTTIRR